MQNASILLSQGQFADVADDWHVHIVETDPRHADVFYIGSYPYEADGRALHPDAPAIANVWDRSLPGARQVSDRQKRIAHFTTMTIFEPVFGRLHA